MANSPHTEEIDVPFDAQSTPALKPGQRLLHGVVEVFDMDLLITYEAEQAIANAPKDLTGLDYETLNSLVSSYLRIYRDHLGDTEVSRFGKRVCAERASRPEYIAVYGRAA